MAESTTSSNPFLDATAPGLLDAIAVRHPQRLAMVLDEERVTFADFRDRAGTLARGLRALGLGPGDNVAIWLPNRPQWFIAQQACARIGAPVIEAFLMSHPAVEQAFVVGVPDAETNEAPVAYVIPRPGAAVDEAELRRFCRGKIASYKIPRAGRVVADVPRTAGPHGDKVQKGKLREQALLELGVGAP